MATETITQISHIPLKTNTALQRRDVATILNYYRDPGDGSPPTPVYVGGNTVTNERPTAPTPVIVRDITGSEDEYTLDTHGFQLIRHESEEKTFDNDERLKTQYYSECEGLYRKITGATQAHLFGHLVRRGPTHWHTLGANNGLKKGPLHRVHIDQSYSGADLLVRKNFPSLVPTLLEHPTPPRWSIVNLWRPISKIYKDPLAVAAATSILDEDLIEAKVVYTKQAPPLNENRTWTVLPNERHEWFFKNEQKADEVLLIKCYDSRMGNGLARRAPHCAFKDPEREGEEWADRESVEIRAVLVWDE